MKIMERTARRKKWQV